MRIESIKNLLLALNACDLSNSECNFLDVMKTTNVSFKEWEECFLFRDDRPAIVCIFENENYQLFLSCWEKGQEGPIHDISSEEVWIHPICGQFIEERFRKTAEKNELEQVSSIVLTDQSYSYMQKSKSIYRYINTYESRSVCLHLYSKPVSEWREYDLKTGGINMVAHTYDRLLLID